MDASEICTELSCVENQIENVALAMPDLRDRFAIAALQGLLSSPHQESWNWPPFSHQPPDIVARNAYALADAMLAARVSSTSEELRLARSAAWLEGYEAATNDDTEEGSPNPYFRAGDAEPKAEAG